MSNNTQDIFEYASRHKLRFESIRGQLTVEHLWDLPLTSKDGFNLDAVARATNKALKDLTEESFVKVEKTAVTTHAEVRLAVVKRVIEVKIAEEERAKKLAANRAEKARLLKILAEKQEGAMSALTAQELQARIDALET